MTGTLHIRNQTVMLTISAQRQTKFAGQLRTTAATGCRQLALSGDRSQKAPLRRFEAHRSTQIGKGKK
jgi:hypothetical protein